MPDALNPETLKALRNQRGWSQERLVEEIKKSKSQTSESYVSKSQISRWERGQQATKIRRTSRDALCRALGVKWEALTKPPAKPSPSQFLERVPLKAGIRGEAKTALTLICRRYGLREEAVLDLAPLAFFILAERSLRARRQALDEAKKALDEATKAACARLPYLPGAFGGGYDSDWTDCEGESLRKKDVFAIHEDDEGHELSPFVGFLEKELADFGPFQKHPLEFSPRYWSAPDYEIPAEVLAEWVALDPEKDDDRAILGRIQQGLIDLEEVFKKKGEATEDEYRRWLTERHQAVEEEIRSQFPTVEDLF